MNFKRIAALACAAVMTLSVTVFGAEEIKVNGSGLEKQGYTKNGKIMLPLRETAEKLGYTVTWIADKNAAIVDSGTVRAGAFVKDDIYMGESGYESRFTNGVDMMDGSIYVPEDFFLCYFFTKIDDENGLVNYEPENPKVRSTFGELEMGNWIGLTNEQMLEDFDYLYKILKENYPYFGTLKRMYGVDLDEEYHKSRKLVESCKSDAEFFVILDSFTSTANMVGHLSTITPMDYDWFVEAYNNTDGIPKDYLDHMRLLADTYGNELSSKSYGEMQELFWPVFDKVQAYYAALEPDTDTNDGQYQQTGNVETRIIEEGKTAYIAVNSFDMTCYEEDKKTLFDFYENVKDYDNIIFDFTMNGGGGMSYFDDLIVAPNIDRPLSADAYELAKDGEYNNKFMDTAAWENILGLPALPRMNKDDLKNLDKMRKVTYTVEPLGEEKALNGKIWILVSGNVFSSSEYAAMFTKSTGFATLVGTQTGGDGIGSDPLPIVMPNSGLIVRYSSIYGISPDGAGSQEFGTTPDIISPEGEDALTTCLKQIAE